MDALLRGIRRYITPRELAELLHWHPETVYRKIKAGMPADRVVDAQRRGRQLKIYPPQVADWLRGWASLNSIWIPMSGPIPAHMLLVSALLRRFFSTRRMMTSSRSLLQNTISTLAQARKK
jgi:hypothetical protein